MDKSVAQYGTVLDQNEAAFRKETELFGKDLWLFR